MSRAFLYVVGVRDGDRIRGPVKIGITKSMGGRLAALQTGNPAPLGVYFAADLDERGLAAGLEAVFHHVMASKRLVGEWFDMSPEEARFAFKTHCRRFLLDAPASELRRFEALSGYPAS
jgi:hypothetical protein